MKCIAYFSIIEPLSICEQFIDKKKATVTYGNFFLSDTVMHKYKYKYKYCLLYTSDAADE